MKREFSLFGRKSTPDEEKSLAKRRFSGLVALSGPATRYSTAGVEWTAHSGVAR
ncbi:MAG: hypothetical protein OEL76_15455 [Siculibacillus sp.]|nr:hypothetical protein [Siculibacillus sp.]